MREVFYDGVTYDCGVDLALGWLGWVARVGWVGWVWLGGRVNTTLNYTKCLVLWMKKCSAPLATEMRPLAFSRSKRALRSTHTVIFEVQRENEESDPLVIPPDDARVVIEYLPKAISYQVIDITTALEKLKKQEMGKLGMPK